MQTIARASPLCTKAWGIKQIKGHRWHRGRLRKSFVLTEKRLLPQPEEPLAGGAAPPKDPALFKRASSPCRPLRSPQPPRGRPAGVEGANPSGTPSVPASAGTRSRSPPRSRERADCRARVAACRSLLRADRARWNTRSSANCFVKREIKFRPLSPLCSTYLPPHQCHLPPAWGPLKGSLVARKHPLHQTLLFTVTYNQRTELNIFLPGKLFCSSL